MLTINAPDSPQNQRRSMRWMLCFLLSTSCMFVGAAQAQAVPGVSRLLLDPVERRMLELARDPGVGTQSSHGRTMADLRLAAEHSLGLGSGKSPWRDPMAPSTVAIELPAVKAESEPPASPQRLDGWVLRVAGRSTVWVNGEPLYRFDQAGEARADLVQRGLVGAKKPARPGEALPGGLSLRPGQTWTPPAETNDLLPPGAVVIHRPGAGS